MSKPKYEKKLVAQIDLPILPNGQKAWRCDADPNHFEQMAEINRKYPHATSEGNVHEGYKWYDWVKVEG